MNESDLAPKLRRVGQCIQLLVRGRPTLLLAGEVHNSASSCLTHMDGVFRRAKELNCNALFVPVSWELVEPAEGCYDFSLVDGLIERARAMDLLLIPLWFGAFKNTWCTYAPGWVKADLTRFPRQQPQPGMNTGALCVFGDEARRCDARAFAAMMEHIRQVDQMQQTVVMVQVENEVGMLGGSRDHCRLAEAAFATDVPAALMEYLMAHADTLRQEVRTPWEAAGQRTSGTWSRVFGSAADEIFMAWGFGQFVGQVAQAGRREYDLPMFANAWLVQYPGEAPGAYPSGGPVSRVMDIWRAAAPSLDLLTPDIYIDDFKGVCADYCRSGNPLLIPEARREEAMAAKALYAFGQHNAIAFAPFGVESVGLKGSVAIDGVVAAASLGNESSADAACLLTRTYAMLSNMAPQILEATAAGRCAGVLQTGNAPETIHIGGYTLRLDFSRALSPDLSPAGGIILSPQDGEFIVAGFGFSVRFLSNNPAAEHTDFLELSDGSFAAGKWIPGRRLNGDEYALCLPWAPSVRLVKLYRYAQRS